MSYKKYIDHLSIELKSGIKISNSDCSIKIHEIQIPSGTETYKTGVRTLHVDRALTVAWPKMWGYTFTSGQHLDTGLELH